MLEREEKEQWCKREGEDGEAVTQEMEREWGRENALRRKRYREGWGGEGVDGSRSASYESNSSVGTQVEYFSNIIAGELLSAPAIRCVCAA